MDLYLVAPKILLSFHCNSFLGCGEILIQTKLKWRHLRCQRHQEGVYYTQSGAHRFKFLDIGNYLAGGVSYSAFLRAYKINADKSYFPYEWFDQVTKLDFPQLPPYESIYCVLKQKNVLEIRGNDDDYDKDVVAEIGRTRHQELQDIWLQQVISPFKDFLIYYNNLDVRPFVQVVKKMQQFYFANKIDLFKVSVSVPGIVRRWLFQTEHGAKTSFGSVQLQDDYLYYTIKQNIVGGPALFSLKMPRWNILLSGTIQSDPVATSSVAMPMPCIWNPLTKLCLVVDMSGELDQTLILTLVSPVRTCFTGWITLWREKMFIFCMLATTSVKYALVPILYTAMAPLLKLCTNSVDAVFMGVHTVRKTRTIWVWTGKCTWKPRKNIFLSKATIWEDHLGTWIQVTKNQMPNWNS